ncbi:MAG: BON domain-containing protein [Chloroflexota bacterium]
MKSNTQIRQELCAEGVPADTEIARIVGQALSRDLPAGKERIQAAVSHGWVTLTGEADRRSDREAAVRIVERLPEVSGVSDLILVTPHTPPIEPHTVHQAIEEALRRRANREAERISVGVEQGTLTLAGDVHSWTERQAIVGAAGHVPGVREVADHLRVRPNA